MSTGNRSLNRIGIVVPAMLAGMFLFSIGAAASSNPPPVLRMPLVLASRQIQVPADGKAGKRYRIEYTADLLDAGLWTNGETITATQTTFSFLDDPFDSAARYYRLSMLPGTNPPIWPDGSRLSSEVPSPTSVQLTWMPVTDLLEVVSYAIYQDGVLIANLAGTSRTYTATGLAPGTAYAFQVQAMNEDTNWTANGPSITVNAAPPDPGQVAPGLDNRGAVLMKPSTAFLYTNSNPIQTGVSTNTIDEARAAVLRGQVSDTNEQALAGVTVSVLGHEEYGQTVTRTNGEFDLSVNGGTALTLVFHKAGYLSLQRTVPAQWQEFQVAEAVVMTPLDANVTAVDFPTNVLQVAQSSWVEDDNGRRRFTLIIPPDTQAAMVLQDGSTQALNRAHIRITEFTRGDLGPEAMPADLPPETEYTYAADYTADEALDVDAKSVVFQPDLYGYLTNFLGLPVGVAIPQGWLDKEISAWVPDEDGRVIRFVAVSNGLAELDVNGDGLAEDAGTLAGMGFSDAERQKLAELYAAGSELWRAPMAHFSDLNFSVGVGPASVAPPPANSASTGNNPTPSANTQGGLGTVEIQNQVFHEDIGIAGTPFSLHYASDRAAGYKAGRTLEIPVISTSIPTLQGIQLQIQVAGRSFEESFAPTNQLAYAFEWDGRDAYGRTLQGRQPLTYRIGYQYTGYYMRPPTNLSATFAGSSGEYITNPVTGERVPARKLQTLWQEETTEIGGWNMVDYSLGGWMLSVHHVFDPVAGIVYLGNGRKQNINGPGASVMMNVAGTGTNGFSGDGEQGPQAQMSNPGGIAVAPDGTTYIADTANHRIRRMSGADTGTIATVVGTGVPGFGGDGGAGANAQINEPRGMAVDREGNLYFADSGNNRIRKLSTNGIVSTVAGTGTAGSAGDDGSATAAELNHPRGMAITPDGTLYVADTANHRVRKVGADGIIATVAGTGAAGDAGDGGPGQQAQLNQPSGVAVDSQGRIFIADTANNRVRQLGRDGTLSTVAGTGTAGYQGDGGGALQAQLSAPASVSVGRGSTLYVADSSNSCVRQIGGERKISTFGGTGTAGYGGNGGPARQAQLNNPQAVAFAPDGRAYVADTQNGAACRLGPQMRPAQLPEIQIASEDGDAVYVFGPEGRHLGTKHALTGEWLYQFQYDPEQRLIGILDRNGKLTRILRDVDGTPTGIQAPFGQVTVLNVDTNNWLTSVANPAGEAVVLGHNDNGLLDSITGPRTFTYEVDYTDIGYVAAASDPSGGTTTFSRVAGIDGREVTRTLPLGQVVVHGISNRSDGAESQVTTYPDGSWSQVIRFADGVTSNRSPAGELSRVVEVPDPRFGMQAPMIRETILATPGGIVATSQHRRVVQRPDPRAIFPIQSQRDETVVNGRTNVVFYDASNLTTTITSPMGRRTTVRTDAFGRLLESARYDWVPLNYTYNTNGQVAAIIQGTGPGARMVRLGYDPSGWLGSRTNALNQVAQFRYDAAGRPTNAVRADGLILAVAYDGEGNPTSIAPPGRPAHGFSYTPVGLLSGYEPPAIGGATNRKAFAWNAARQPASITRADGAVIAYTYDTTGQLSRISMPGNELIYTYNAQGQIASLTATNENLTIGYDYDGHTRVGMALTGPVTGTVAATMDNNFWITTLSVNGGAIQSNSYDSDGLLVAAGDLLLVRNPTNGSVSRTVLGGFTNEYQYNSFGELAGIAVFYKGTNLYSAGYGRDALGRITNRVESIGSAPPQANACQYDLAGRLVRVTKPGLQNYDYQYDANGNRTNHLRPGQPPSGGTFDLQDRMLTCGSNTYAWSTDGELTNVAAGASSTAYRYDAFGNLTGAVLPGGTNIEYMIDGMGRRVGKKVGGVLRRGFLYGAPTRVIAELDGSNQVVSVFVYASQANVPDYMVRSGATYRILSDHLGSPRLVVDVQTGAIVQQMDHDEFGRVLLDTNPGFQPFGFAGGLYDPDTRLVHFDAREYDPETGRWTSRDPVLFAGADANLYAYIHNDPVNGRDPLGTGPATGNQSPASSSQPSPGHEQGHLSPIPPPQQVFVMMGAEPSGGGVSINDGNGAQGYINDFDHWLTANHYSLSYTEGDYAAIHDENHHVVGVVSAADAGFQDVPYQAPPPLSQVLGQAANELGQQMSQQFQSSLQIPWDQLNGQQFWNAAGNPQEYIQNHPQR